MRNLSERSVTRKSVDMNIISIIVLILFAATDLLILLLISRENLILLSTVFKRPLCNGLIDLHLDQHDAKDYPTRDEGNKSQGVENRVYRTT